MRDDQPPPGAEGHPGVLPEELRRSEFRREVEFLVDTLRQWLLEFEECGGEAEENGADLPAADLHSIAAELAALRGEVRLESRGSKTAREKMDQAAESFREGLGTLQDGLMASREHLEASLLRALAPLLRERDRLRDELRIAREEPARRLLEGLMDAVDTLRRSRDATERAHRRLRWRSRLLPPGLIAGLIDGYDMALRKLEASLADLGVEEILCEGSDFDPSGMRTVETEPRSDVPAGRVLGVIRAGYRRGQTVVRPAEVRTAVAPVPPAADWRQPEAKGRNR
ncbi:MAG: nucleotide exchange factor GrpE [Planctomycetes bacterium]|nr:nucleotide exchange factor GrpE [Planctomycetota bacterium]